MSDRLSFRYENKPLSGIYLYDEKQCNCEELEAEVSGRKQDAESLCTQIKELKARKGYYSCKICPTKKQLTEERAKAEELDQFLTDACNERDEYAKRAEEAEAMLNDFHTMAEFAQTDLDASKGVSGGTVACRLRNELLAFVTLANQHKAREQVKGAEKVRKYGNLESSLTKANDDFKAIGKLIHWPECWDTSVYPTILAALEEYFGCEPFCCNGYECETKEKRMFSVRQKREISEAVQDILRATDHPELPEGEIVFRLHVSGKEDWSYAEIKNNGQISAPSVNPWNEKQDPQTLTTIPAVDIVQDNLSNLIPCEDYVVCQNATTKRIPEGTMVSVAGHAAGRLLVEPFAGPFGTTTSEEDADGRVKVEKAEEPCKDCYYGPRCSLASWPCKDCYPANAYKEFKKPIDITKGEAF